MPTKTAGRENTNQGGETGLVGAALKVIAGALPHMRPHLMRQRQRASTNRGEQLPHGTGRKASSNRAATEREGGAPDCCTKVAGAPGPKSERRSVEHAWCLSTGAGSAAAEPRVPAHPSSEEQKPELHEQKRGMPKNSTRTRTNRNDWLLNFAQMKFS